MFFVGVTEFGRAHAFYAAPMAELGLVQKFRDDSRPWAGWMATNCASAAIARNEDPA
jgi:hypothetical protein